MPRTAPASQRQTGSSAQDPFVASVGGFDRDRLATLLELRPDLAEPPPRGLADLLRRAAVPASVYRAVDHLDLFAYQVVRAVMALDGSAFPSQIAELLGLAAGEEAVARAVHEVEGLLLAAVDVDGAVHVHRTLGLVFPGGDLGPPVASALELLTVDELRWIARHWTAGSPATRKADLVSSLAAVLSDADGVRRAVSEAPPAAAMLAGRLARRGPRVEYGVHSLYPRFSAARSPVAVDPVQWLAWHGLVVKERWYGCVMPREVSLALRGGRLFEEVWAERPSLRIAGGPDPGGDAAALAAATELVAHVEALAEALAAAPAPLLKSGGLGVRQVRRLAKATELSEERVTLLIELASAAGLLGCQGSPWDGTGEALPTAAYDAWCEGDPAERWAALAAAWWTAESFPSLAGTRDEDGKPFPALQQEELAPEAANQRRVVLRLLAELPEHTAPDRASLVAAAEWQAPLALAAGPGGSADHVGWTMAEATVLGIVHHDALSVLGRHVALGDVVGATEALGRRAGRASTDLVLQADLTAIAPAVAPRRFRERLDSIADVESKGATVIYRFTDRSVGRAFDLGLSADDVLGFLREHATTEVPQALAYLVRDVARRHGSVRVGEAGSYVRCADEASATEVLRARRTAKLGLRALSPTVLVTAAEPAVVTATLRAAGYLPAHEDSGGGLVVPRPLQRRAPAGARRPAPVVDRETAWETAGWLRDGEEPPGTERSPEDGTCARGDGGERTSGLALLRAVRGEAPREGPSSGAGVLGSGCTCERPPDIARGPEAVRALLTEARAHEWTVRMAMDDMRGKGPQSFFAEVEQVEDGELTAWRHDRERTIETPLAAVAWARVLTEAEERALFVDGIE